MTDSSSEDQYFKSRNGWNDNIDLDNYPDPNTFLDLKARIYQYIGSLWFSN